MGTTFTVAQQHPTRNEGHAIKVPIHYRDDDLFNAVSKIERTLFRCGVRGISGDAVLRHAIGFSHDPLTLTGLKFNNIMKYKPKQMNLVFLRKEREMAAAILKIVFGEADSVARNSSPITLEVVRTELSFCFKTAFREAIVYYKAIGSKPADTYRVTIRGVGIDSPSTMELEGSYEWTEFRYRYLKHNGLPIATGTVAKMPPQLEVQQDELHHECPYGRPIPSRADFGTSSLVTTEEVLVQGIHVDVKPTFDARRITKHCPQTEVEPVVNQCDGGRAGSGK